MDNLKIKDLLTVWILINDISRHFEDIITEHLSFKKTFYDIHKNYHELIEQVCKFKDRLNEFTNEAYYLSDLPLKTIISYLILHNKDVLEYKKHEESITSN